MDKKLKKVIESIILRKNLNDIIIEVNEDNKEYVAELKGENIALDYVLEVINKEI